MWLLGDFLAVLTTPGLRVGYMVLRPSLDVALTRAGLRPDRLLREDPVRHMHREFTTRMGGHEAYVVDTSDYGVDETVEIVGERLRSGAHAVAPPA